MSSMGSMGMGGKAPDASGLAMAAIKIYTAMTASDKKLKKNIKTISNFKEILYG